MLVRSHSPHCCRSEPSVDCRAAIACQASGGRSPTLAPELLVQGVALSHLGVVVLGIVEVLIWPFVMMVLMDSGIM
jgi:hypothetical protein